MWQLWLTIGFASLAILPHVIAWYYSILYPCQTPYLMRSAWRFFCLTRILCSRIQQLKQAGKPLIWVIVWVIVGVVMTQKEGLCLCACVSKREKVKENKSKREGVCERERPHLCSPWDGIFMDGWASWGLRTHKESFSVCCRQLTVCACLLNFQ